MEVTVMANVSFDQINKGEVFTADPDNEPRIAGLIEGGYLAILESPESPEDTGTKPKRGTKRGDSESDSEPAGS